MSEPLTETQILEIFEQCGALMHGHFVLSSGRHSATYLNKSLVSMYPAYTQKLCMALAQKIQDTLDMQPDYIISPAMGAIIYGYETARHLKVPFMFTERVDGNFVLRRGFSVPKGAKIIVIEDIVSTGLSARECLDAVRRHGGEPYAVACLVDRSQGEAQMGVPLLPLARWDVESFEPHALPDHLKRIPAVKPGSRGIQ